MCRSWEHLLILLFLSAPLSLPLPALRAMRSHAKEALQQVSMRFGFIGSCPLHLVPCSAFPFTHFCSPLFFHVLLSSCLGISLLLSFARTSVPALVCTRTSSRTFNPGFRSPRLDKGSLFDPVHLFPFHRYHVHFCPVSSSFHVFVLLSVRRAHACTFALTLVLRLFFGEACVCV